MHSAWLSVLGPGDMVHVPGPAGRALFHVEQINMHLGSLAAGRASLTTGHQACTTHHRPRIVPRGTMAADQATRITDHGPRARETYQGKRAADRGPGLSFFSCGQL